MGWMRRLLNSGAAARPTSNETSPTRSPSIANSRWPTSRLTDGLLTRRGVRRGAVSAWPAPGSPKRWPRTRCRGSRRGRARPGRRCVDSGAVPWLTCTAVTTMAVGAGVLLAAFTVVDTALLVPLPFDEASHDWSCWKRRWAASGSGATRRAWRTGIARSRAFRAWRACTASRWSSGRGAEARRVQVTRGVGPFADVLRLRAAHGRTFTAAGTAGRGASRHADRPWLAAVVRACRCRCSRRRSLSEGRRTRSSASCHPRSTTRPTSTSSRPPGPSTSVLPRGGNWLQVVGRLAPGATIVQGRAGGAIGRATVRARNIRRPTRASTCV